MLIVRIDAGTTILHSSVRRQIAGANNPAGVLPMPRLMGVDIPNDKQIQYSLTYLYGLGLHSAREVCEKLGIDPTSSANDLTEEQVGQIATMLERDYTVEGPLRRQTAQNISRLREIKSYRGMRHRQSLPVRGQRTKTNSRTRKGPRKTVAGKKGVKDLR